MHLLQALLLRRRVFQWLVPLITLWVAIVCGLAFLGEATADKRGGEQPALDLQQDHSTLLPSPREYPTPVVYQPTAPAFALVKRADAGLDGLSGSPPESDLSMVMFDGDPQLARQSSPFSQVEYPFLLEGECPTPMSLMLHAAYGPVRMWKLAREIVARGLVTTTYQEIATGLEKGECPAEGSLVVSLDDFPTDWLRPEFVALADIFADRGLVLVIGAVVGGPQDSEAWLYLRRLEEQGFEVASHTLDHYSLSQIDPERIEEQISGSYDVICRNLGRCPDTLILPFGNIDEPGHTYAAARDYAFVVGIPGGRWFGGEPPFYVGRIGPDNFDEQATLHSLAASFGSERSSTSAMRALEQIKSARCFASPAGLVAAPHYRCSRAHSGDAPPDFGFMPQNPFAPLRGP